MSTGRDRPPGDADGAVSSGAAESGSRSPRAPESLSAGLIGRPHGLDGSFHVQRPQAQLLQQGASVSVDGRTTRIVRRAGTDERPIVRLEGCPDRDGAQALQGRELRVSAAQAPALEPGEWWAQELEGCQVVDRELAVGVVRGLLALPSCEALEVEREGGGVLLIPLVADAVREVDVEERRIDVSLRFLGAEA